MAFRRPGLHLRHKRVLKNGGAGVFSTTGTASWLTSETAAFPLVGPYLAPILATSMLAAGAAWATSHLCRTVFGPDDDLDSRPATAREVGLIHDELQNYTGSLLVPLDERLEIHRQNRRCFTIIYHDSDRGRIKDLAGMIIVYPLRKPAWRAMFDGKLTGRDVRASHVVSRWSSAAALYISFACGDDFTSRGFVMRELGKIVTNYEAPVATRPTTEPALKRVREIGFRTFSGEEPVMNEICWIDYARLKNRIPASRYH